MIAWTAVSSGQMPTGFIQHVLVWDAFRGVCEVAWLEDGEWIDTSDGDYLNKADITHWAALRGPNGESQIFPMEDDPAEVQP